ncbi:hypothetical protein K502DRAFT_316933 [Neoconidiobolus thromboides FSU 785]|nr:hypothetical protein K502DRAFT_316933 [Neoconidiobolus thromboides FSU 785]
MGSYNRQLRNPNFVIEVLTEAKLNQTGADRDKSKFKEDDSIPKLFRGLLKDYSKSGYDRGHMAPAGDVKYSQSAMDETIEKASGLIFFDKLGPNKETENSKLCDKITCKFTSKFGES